MTNIIFHQNTEKPRTGLKKPNQPQTETKPKPNRNQLKIEPVKVPEESTKIPEECGIFRKDYDIHST